MAKDGIKITIRADIREAEKAMAAMEKQAAKVKNLEKEWAGLKKEYDSAGKAAEKAASDVDKAFAKLQAAQKEQAAIAASLKEQFNLGSGINTSRAYETALDKNKDYQKVTAEIDRLRATLGQLHESMSNAEVDQSRLADEMRDAEQRVAQEREELGRLSDKATKANRSVERMSAAFAGVKSVLSKVGRSAKSAAKSLLSMVKGSDKTNNSFSSGIKTILKYTLGIQSLYLLFNKLRSAMVEGVKNLAQYSTECNANISALMSSLTRLKNSLATAFSPILTVITPALTALIDKLSTAITYVGMLFAALSGAKSFTRAKAVTEDYAASLREAGEAAEEAAGALAGFDEINQIATDSSPTGGSGTAAPADMFETMEIAPLSFNSWGKAFSTFLNSILEDGIPRLREGLLAFANWLNGFSADLYEMFTFPGVADKVAAIGGELAYALNDMVNAIDWVTLGGALGAGLNLALLFLVNFLYSFDWINLGASIATLLNSAVVEIDWYSFGLLLWAKFKIVLETLAGFLLNLDMAQLAQAASNIVKGFFNSMAQTVQEIDWRALGTRIGIFLSNIDWWGVITSVATAISEAIMGLLEIIAGVIEGLSPEMLLAIGLVVAAIIAGVPAFIAAIGAAIVAAIAALPAALIVTIGAAIALLVAYIKSGGGDVVLGFLQGVKDGMASIGAWLKEHVVDPFINGFKSLFGIHSPSTVMAEMGGYLIQGLQNGLTGLWGKVKGYFTEALNGIKDTFSVSALKSIGVNAVTGLMNGLKSVGSKVTSWAKGILSNIKDTLGIHSPSKETEAVGEYTVAGYINGLTAYGNKLRHAVSNMAESTLSTLAKGVSPSLEMPVRVTQLSSNATRVKLAEPAYATGRVLPVKSAVVAANASAADTSTERASFSTIKQALLEALQEAGGLGNGSDIHITVELDGKVVARNTVKHINDMTVQAGKPVLKF